MTPWPSSPTGWKAPLLRGAKVLQGRQVVLLEGPLALLFPLAVAEGGYLALPRGFREALDDLG
jgi:hypothetical protein